MYEVVIDSKIRSEIFLHSVTIFDYFLELCLDVEIQQVQLCASACLRLASKVRNDELEEDKIIDYTDNSITKSELKVRIIELLLLDIQYKVIKWQLYVTSKKFPDKGFFHLRMG